MTIEGGKKRMKRAKVQLTDPTAIARANWDRYTYIRQQRGHEQYIKTAKRLEEFYLGGGLQWTPEDRAAVEASGRPCIEINAIFPAVNTAKGIQLNNRASIAYRPRNSMTDQQRADTITKVAMQVCDDIRYHWLESQVFEDGLIQQRGFLELYVDFTEDMTGVVAGAVLDPMDVMPDPDANSYDPATWADVTVLRWMTVDEIEQLFGESKAVEIEAAAQGSAIDSGDYDTADRNSFGDSEQSSRSDWIWIDGGVVRVLVVSRQHRRYELSPAVVLPGGKIDLAERYTPEEIAEIVARGGVQTKRIMRRIRWTVSTADTLLHDDWSPYRTFTVIPYFPYFRRGKTRGMVDNATSPQELLNKTTSQTLHVANTSANSGWIVEENSLTNMRTEDLEDQGAKTGLVLEYRKNASQPEKILPNQIPTGIDRIADKAELAIKTITGISDAMQGLNGPEVSGVAIQTKQYMGQTQMAGPLDNLALTRNMVGRKLLELIQDFYTEERVFLITDESDPTQTKYLELAINREIPGQGIDNDITIGDYDVVVTDVPIASTFEDNQFQQAMAMREKGINIPDSFIIEASALAKKNDIIKTIAGQTDPVAEAEAEERQAKARLLDAQTEKTRTETVTKSVEAQFSAMQAANVVATTPQTAPIADALLKSAGFEDQDQAPIVPQSAMLAGVPAPPAGSIEQNTNPLTPANPGTGLKSGIETPRNENGNRGGNPDEQGGDGKKGKGMAGGKGSGHPDRGKEDQER